MADDDSTASALANLSDGQRRHRPDLLQTKLAALFCQGARFFKSVPSAIPQKPLCYVLATRASRLAEHPHQGRHWSAWGFLFAIDCLQNYPRVVLALLDIADEFTVRPTYDEVLAVSRRLLSIEREIAQVVRDQGLWNGPTPRFRFIRRA
jgi:hypothetical protein